MEREVLLFTSCIFEELDYFHQTRLWCNQKRERCRNTGTCTLEFGGQAAFAQNGTSFFMRSFQLESYGSHCACRYLWLMASCFFFFSGLFSFLIRSNFSHGRTDTQNIWISGCLEESETLANTKPLSISTRRLGAGPESSCTISISVFSALPHSLPISITLSEWSPSAFNFMSCPAP